MMKANFIDLSGKRAGRLLVQSRDGSTSDGRAKWLCRCDCGNEVSVDGRNLRQGLTTSCGCFHKEVLRERNLSHGMSSSSTYGSYHAMKNRCLNENQEAFPRYGGAGVHICSRWLDSFENFLADMGEKPSDDHTLDRFPNVNGGYEPGNCRWATRAEQNRNKRGQVAVKILGALASGEISAEQAIRAWEDGYKSWSPAEAFEDGYTLIQ